MTNPATPTVEALVFDTGPLTHFARQGWLGVLKAIVDGKQVLIPDTVVGELQHGIQLGYPNQPILDATWIEHRILESAEEITAFALFSQRLVRGTENVGEAGVLALASTIGATVVVDDSEARRAADDFAIPKRPTLALLCDAIRSGLLTVPLVSALADDLLASRYHFPFRPGHFEKWATDEGML